VTAEKSVPSACLVALGTMPRPGKGLQSRPRAKPGTNNAKQAAARDKRAADASTAELQATAEALAALDDPAPVPTEEQPSPEPEAACEPSNGELASYKRMAIVSHYQQLGCPPESEWGKHGGTLRQLANAFDMPDPNMGTFSLKPRKVARRGVPTSDFFGR